MKQVLCFALLAVLAGCQTVHTVVGRVRPDYRDLPVEAVRQVADDIERAVDAGEREPVIASPEGVAVDTERIRQAIRTRAARAEILEEFLNAGHGWERRDSQVWVIRSSDYKKATTRGERDRNALLVMSESQDRWAIYEGLIEANNFPPGSLSAIQDIFFQARLKYLEEGQKFETESGDVGISGRDAS